MDGFVGSDFGVGGLNDQNLSPTQNGENYGKIHPFSLNVALDNMFPVKMMKNVRFPHFST